MTSKTHETPSGIYFLSGFALLLILDILLDLGYSSANNYVLIISTAITIPLLSYVGIGIIQRWPGVRNAYLIVALLLFAGSLVQIAVPAFVEGASWPAGIDVVRYIGGLAIPPIIYYYLHKSNVKVYFAANT